MHRSNIHKYESQDCAQPCTYVHRRRRAPPVLYDWSRQLHSLQERRTRSSELDSIHEPSGSVNKHQIIDAPRRKRPTQIALGNQWPKPLWHRHHPPTSPACRLSLPQPGLATHTVPCALELAAGLNGIVCRATVHTLGMGALCLFWCANGRDDTLSLWVILSYTVAPVWEDEQHCPMSSPPWKCFLSAERMPELWNI